MSFANAETEIQARPNPSQDKAQSRTLIVAVTGASGSIFAIELLRALEAEERIDKVELVVSPSALRVLAEEAGGSGRSGLLERLLHIGKPHGISRSSKIHLLEHEDIGASIASGSYPTAGMIVLPCSMGTLAGIAHGMAGNLIERAADVCLKERRRLVLCVRETPLNLIHLRNMAAVTEAGATIFPVIPTFYNHPQTIEEITKTYAQRVLLHIGFPQAGAFAWGQDSEAG
jgi:4-hydroxy-3-polyprenylbenzoate decarboxylase